MKFSETQKFEFSLMFLSILAAFLWGSLLEDNFPYKFYDPAEKKVMGTATQTEQEVIPKIEDALQEQYFECFSNSDCTAIAQTCCGCSEGGEMIAVNRGKIDEYKASLDCDNANYTCIGINTCYPREAICDLGMCYLKEPNEDQTTSRIDFNLDTKAGSLDYAIFLDEYLKCRNDQCESLVSDMDEDKKITLQDYYIFLDDLISE